MTDFQKFLDLLPSHRKAKQHRLMVQQFLLAGIGLGLLLMGLVAGYSLSTRQASLDLRQQAAGEIQPSGESQIAGFGCDGTRCNLAKYDWCTPVCLEPIGPAGSCKYPDGSSAWWYGNPQGDGVCSNGGGYVNCAPTHKAVKFYCPQGLDASGKCRGTGINILPGQINAGGSVDLSSEMLEKCGAYQFDFSDEASLDDSGNCGAVTYVWPACGSTPGNPQSPPPGSTPTPTPVPPSCTVTLVQRINNQNVQINGDVLQMKVGQSATVRARVQNLPAIYEIDSVTFRSQNPDIASFNPEPTLDEIAPYDGTFTVNKYLTTSARLRARVRLKHRTTGQVINEVSCETHLFLQPLATPTPTPTRTPSPTPSFTPTPTPTFTPSPTPTRTPTPSPTPTKTPTPTPTPTRTPTPSPTPTKTPTPTPTFTPTPTPVAGCNQACTVNADCNNSQHICVEISGSRVCRLQSHIFSTTCTPPTPTPTATPTPTITITPTVTPGLPAAGGSAVTNVIVITAGLGVLILGSLVFLLLL